MNRGRLTLSLVGLCGSLGTVATLLGLPAGASAQGTKIGVERLYVLNCGEGGAATFRAGLRA